MIITNDELLKELENTGALLSGHFLLSSGKHSTNYLQCAKLLQHPILAAKIGEAIADKFSDLEIDVVTGPAVGALIVGHEVARALGVRYAFSERENGTMTFRRGLDIVEGERALAIEDVITTGGSVKENIDAAHRFGGKVVGVGSIIDRSGGKAEFGAPFRALLQVNFPVYDPDNLPAELQNSTAVKPGSRVF
jgi:orotate phosphoribosyltransferase